jgi:hypothetical protein
MNQNVDNDGDPERRGRELPVVIGLVGELAGC